MQFSRCNPRGQRRHNTPRLDTVILSEAKDMVCRRTKRKQIRRFAQDDSFVEGYFLSGNGSIA